MLNLGRRRPGEAGAAAPASPGPPAALVSTGAARPAPARAQRHGAPIRGPTVQKLDVMIARLRLLLAEVATRESQAANLHRQLGEQMNRLVSFSVYGDGDLDRSLGLMADVEARLRDAEARQRHLALIRQRVERELESLLLTKGVEEAKSRLVELQRQKNEIGQRLAAGVTEMEAANEQADLAQAEATLAEQIRRLQSEINEASERAARSIENQPRR